jgi:uncharacterized protein (TIGR03067 family)
VTDRSRALEVLAAMTAPGGIYLALEPNANVADLGVRLKSSIFHYEFCLELQPFFDLVQLREFLFQHQFWQGHPLGWSVLLRRRQNEKTENQAYQEQSKPGTEPRPLDQEIEGSWSVISAERDGRPLPAFANAVCTFTEGKFTLHRSDNMVRNGHYEVDTAKQPKEMTMSGSGGRPWAAIYKVEGDELALCFADASAGTRPTEFSGNAGPTQTLIVFQRNQP